MQCICCLGLKLITTTKQESHLGGARTCVILGEAGLSPAKPCRDETQVTNCEINLNPLNVFVTLIMISRAKPVA